MATDKRVKNGIEYFSWHPRDSKLMNDLVVEFQDESTTRILLSILSQITSDQGYYTKWNERELKRFAFYNHISAEKYQLINDLVDYLLAQDYFDNEKYIQFGILTSKEIQNQYVRVVMKGKQPVEWQLEYLCEGIPAFIQREEEKKQKDKDRKKKIENPLNNEETAITSETANFPTLTPLENDNFPEVLHSESIPIPTQNTDKKREEKKREEKKREEENRKEFSISNFQENFTSTDLVLDSKKIINSLDSMQSFENEGIPIEKPPEQPPEKEKKYTQGGEKKGKHPAREAILTSWQERFELGYVPDYENNVGVNHVIKTFEKQAKARGHPTEEVAPEEIVKMFQSLMSNWSLLDEFYSKQINFKSIAKNIENILNQIKERTNGNNGKNVKKGNSKLYSTSASSTKDKSFRGS